MLVQEAAKGSLKWSLSQASQLQRNKDEKSIPSLSLFQKTIHIWANVFKELLYKFLFNVKTKAQYDLKYKWNWIQASSTKQKSSLIKC